METSLESILAEGLESIGMTLGPRNYFCDELTQAELDDTLAATGGRATRKDCRNLMQDVRDELKRYMAVLALEGVRLPRLIFMSPRKMEKLFVDDKISLDIMDACWKYEHAFLMHLGASIELTEDQLFTEDDDLECRCDVSRESTHRHGYSVIWGLYLIGGKALGPEEIDLYIQSHMYSEDVIVQDLNNLFARRPDDTCSCFTLSVGEEGLLHVQPSKLLSPGGELYDQDMPALFEKVHHAPYDEELLVDTLVEFLQ